MIIVTVRGRQSMTHKLVLFLFIVFFVVFPLWEVIVGNRFVSSRRRRVVISWQRPWHVCIVLFLDETAEHFCQFIDVHSRLCELGVGIQEGLGGDEVRWVHAMRGNDVDDTLPADAHGCAGPA
jgi:hypothetical protein